MGIPPTEEDPTSVNRRRNHGATNKYIRQDMAQGFMTPQQQ